MADHPEHQFGVPDFDRDPRFDAFGREQTVDSPLNEQRNLQVQQQREQAVRDQERENAVEQAIINQDDDLLWNNKIKPIGNVSRPKHDTLAGYKSVLREGEGVLNLEFSPFDYGAFDYVIARKCGMDKTDKSTHPAFNRENPDYRNYAPLRRNIAILRNYLMVRMFPDGVYDPVGDTMASKEDMANLGKIKAIADKLGEALGGQEAKASLFKRWWLSIKRLFNGENLAKPNTSKFLEMANVPDIGIATMYDYLLKLQNHKSVWAPLTGAGPAKWKLPSRDKSAFSDINIQHDKNSSRMIKTSEAFDYIVSNFRSVDTLSERKKAISVEHARTILDRLRLKVEGGIDEFDIEIKDERQEIARDLLKAAYSLRGLMGQLVQENPEAFNDPIIAQSRDALKVLRYRVHGDVVDMLNEEGDTEGAKQRIQEMKLMPEWSKLSEKQMPLTQLLKMLKAGFDQVDLITKGLPPLKAAGIQTLKKQFTPQPSTNPQSQAQQVVQSGVHNFSDAKISSVSHQDLIHAAQQVNEKPIVEIDPTKNGLSKT